MASITTAMATTLKAELMQAGHCFNGTVTPTGNTATSSFAVTNLSSLAGIVVGMGVTGGALSAGAVVTGIAGSNSITVSQFASAASVGAALTFTGDIFKMALIKSGYTGTYAGTNVNYTDITGATDELANGAGYTTGGAALANTTATTNGTGANINFNNPSWTSATFSTSGAMIYNSSIRVAGVSGTNSTGGGRCCGVYTFNGAQTVTSGTFTVTMPAPAPSTAILAIQ
jgi:hypothetical protein